jgi:iron(III) transport system substrate-binding protein
MLLVHGCARSSNEVVVYAAQDRIFAEPIFAEFTRKTGIRVRAVHDNEATKTTGVANRLMVESARPVADVWWSNEEMRTRQLARKGILATNWQAFGQRRRVLVAQPQIAERLPRRVPMALLTNAEYRGRIAIAYPVFGSTANHLLVLRQRWGEEQWRQWCLALKANRPLIVDGNSAVVRLVAKGDAWIGLTDSDDVTFGRREGLSVVDRELASADGFAVPNTAAMVVNAPHPEAARRLAEFLASRDVRHRLIEAGALDPESEGIGQPPDSAVDWDRLLDELDDGLRWLEQTFVR